MKVLFFFSGGFDIEHSSTILMTNVLEDCLEQNLTVHYIIPNETGENKNCPEHLENHSHLSYDVIYKKSPAKNHFVRRYLDGILYSFRCAKYIRKQKDADVIYVQSTPTAFWNILIARVFGHKTPIIYSVLDMFPGSTIASGVMPQKILQIIFFFIQKRAYQLSSHIMCMSSDMKQKIIIQGVDKEKITYFNTWFDTNNLKYVEDKDNSFISEFKMDKKKFYVQYAGNVGYVFDVDLFIDVANSLKEHSDIVFQLVARGSQLEYLTSEVEKKSLVNVEIIPLQPVERISEVYSSCNLQFIPLKHGVIGNSFPSKLAHVMNCHKTFVCCIDENADFFSIANNKRIGICCTNKNHEDAVKAILKFYKNIESISECQENAYTFSEQVFSRKQNTQIIIEQIKKQGVKKN